MLETQRGQVGFGLGTNLTWTDMWTVLSNGTEIDQIGLKWTK